MGQQDKYVQYGWDNPCLIELDSEADGDREGNWVWGEFCS